MRLGIQNLNSKLFSNQDELKQKYNKLKVTSILSTTKKSIFWLKNLTNYSLFKEGVLIISEEILDELKLVGELNKNIFHLICEKNITPRLAYCLLLNECLIKQKSYDETKKHKKNKKIKIFGTPIIFDNVVIGEGSVIYPNVVIHSNVKIGKNCIIRENTSLGGSGMGFEKGLNGEWISFPQLGGLVIGDNVEIGSHCDVKRGAIEDTIISNNCKIGSFTNIGHNSIIGENSLFTNHCVVAGSVKIGQNFFMGINSSIKNGIIIGNNVTVAANVFINKNINDNELSFGINQK